MNIFTALGIEGKHQNVNASLAVHLCQTWIQRRNDGRLLFIPLNSLYLMVETVNWK